MHTICVFHFFLSYKLCLYKLRRRKNCENWFFLRIKSKRSNFSLTEIQMLEFSHIVCFDSNFNHSYLISNVMFFVSLSQPVFSIKYCLFNFKNLDFFDSFKSFVFVLITSRNMRKLKTITSCRK